MGAHNTIMKCPFVGCEDCSFDIEIVSQEMNRATVMNSVQDLRYWLEVERQQREGVKKRVELLQRELCTLKMTHSNATGTADRECEMCVTTTARCDKLREDSRKYSVQLHQMRQEIKKSQKQQNKLSMNITQLKAKVKKDEISDEFNRMDEILTETKTFTTTRISDEVTKLRKEMITHKDQLCSELKSCVGRCEKEVPFLAAEMEEQVAKTEATEAQVPRFEWCPHNFAELYQQAYEGGDMLEHEVSELQKPQPTPNQKLIALDEELNVTLRSVADTNSKLKSFISSVSMEITLLSESDSSST